MDMTLTENNGPKYEMNPEKKAIFSHSWCLCMLYASIAI